ncbi:aspartyl protease family protein [Clostridioides sp. ZZV15-6598]|uniref:aspartyl protease family protein n=1 Tax=Clostridioides sp. ZZV15-6598 TaxID=2811501 RepID=UPI001D111403
MKSLKLRGLCVLLCGALIVGTATACTSKSTSSKSSDDKSTPKATKEINRINYEKQANELKEKYAKKPNDETLGLEYAQTLFTLGDFTEAQEILKPLASLKKVSPEVIYLSAQIEHLNGNYTVAEKLYNTLIEEYPDKFKTKAEDGLVLTYYQTNQYEEASKLSSEKEKQNNAILEMMQSFEDKQPNQINWNGKEESVIPFVTSEPLPVVPVEINGKRINAFIDTGGPMFVADSKLAKELGIKTASKKEGTFQGGNTAEVGFGQVDSLTIGDVNMKNIPVMMGSFEGFEEAFKGKASNVHGIIGTSVLKEFIPTMDYPSGQLVLRPRNEVGMANANKMLANDKVLEEIPFTLASTHYMYAKGLINQKSGMNFFMDSGFANGEGAGMQLPKETMGLAGIPMPELNEGQSSGMGGSDYKDGTFEISSYGLGSLQLKNGVGNYTTGEESRYYEEVGFFEDGLIGHNYFKNYKWTMDFESMKMTFSNLK